MKKQQKKHTRTSLALFLILALLAGILPVSQAPVSKALDSAANRHGLKNPVLKAVEPSKNTSHGLSNPRNENGRVTWDCVYFGNYPQSDATGATKEPIKWRVLSVNGDDVFLLADTNLDVQKYNDTDTSVTWETCTMRTWLNNNFLNKAFSISQQAAIKDTVVVNEDNPDYGTEGGNDTIDKVYLLSISEVMNPAYGFNSTADNIGTDTREAVNTAYVAAGGETGTSDMSRVGNTDLWWLRSPGELSNYASHVSSFGYVYHSHVNRSDYNVGVRPALHLNLSSDSVWENAGQVTSEGGEVTGTWDCVWFGNYPQSDVTGVSKEPIKWRVLSVNGDDAFLLADKNLDVQRYNAINTDVTWETCTIRTWLNSNFLNKAFSESEQEAIQNTDVVNEDNPEYGTEGGNDTTDKVYLLSISEVKNPAYGFISTTGYTATREAVNTTYVAAGGGIKSDNMSSAGSKNHWWLRSPGSHFASYVYYYGSVDQYGSDGFYGDDTAVRPALHLNLSSTSVWSYAGSVSSDGEGTDTEKPPSVPTASPIQTTFPDQTSAPAGNVNTSSAQNLVAPSSAPAQDLTEKTGEDEIAPAKVTALKLKAKKKALQASWKKVSGASGYEVWISTSKKFKKKSVKTTKKTKLTIGKRKAKKVYFVKVRAYTVKSGEKVYGAWSKTMKKKVK